MIPEIVKRAMLHTVVNIGQLSDTEMRQLDRAVRLGYLAKDKGGPYPVLKTVWALPTYDFRGERAAWIAYLMSLPGPK